MENHHFFIGKPSINGPVSMAMLNNQMVIKPVNVVHTWSIVVCSDHSMGWLPRFPILTKQETMADTR